jgi:hypothetical protein
LGPIEIRPPPVLRLYVVIFMTIWCGGVLAVLVLAVREGDAAAVIPALMFVFGAGLGFRLFRLGVTAEGETLVIRNNLRTARIRRDEIEGFRLSSPAAIPFGRVIYALLRDESILRLDVTVRPAVTARGRAKMADWLAQLRAWQGT